MLKVTVVIPAYNAGNFLNFTLNSIESQSFKNFECIIVNDASSDNTAQISLQYVRKDPRFRLISHKVNSGSSASRNTGIRLAKASLITFLDADDLMMRDSLYNRVNILKENELPHLIGTYCASKTIQEQVVHPPRSEKVNNLRFVDFISAGGKCPFNANQPMLKTELLRNFSGFDETLTQAEDYDLWNRILRAGYSFIPTPVSGVCYRTRKGSMIRKEPLHHLKTSLQYYYAAHSKNGYIHPYNEKTYATDKEWIAYKNQLDICNRVFEFCGMALAQDEPIRDIAKVIATEIPDVFSKVRLHMNPSLLLKKGINRYLCQNVENSPPYIKNHFDLQIEQLLREVWKYLQANEKYANTKDSSSKPVDLVFLPHKDYHIWTISLIKDELERLGVSYIIVDLSIHLKDEGVRYKAEELGMSLIGYSMFSMGYYLPKTIVSFNDWDPVVRSIMVAAQNTGIGTACIVEGIQDYNDADINRVREAYRTAEHILLPGSFDEKYFCQSWQKTYITGVTRVSNLRRKETINFPEIPSILINSNFSYNVLVEHRDEWVRSAVDACKTAGLNCTITRHPADIGLEHKELETEENFYNAVVDSSVVIQRFASGVLEALAMGRPVIYYNPHDERVDKFSEPLGAYPIVRTKDELVYTLIHWEELKQRSSCWNKFLDIHCGQASSEMDSAPAKALKKIIKSYSPNFENLELFKSNLLALDHLSLAFTKLKPLTENFQATFGSNHKPGSEYFTKHAKWKSIRDAEEKSHRLITDKIISFIKSVEKEQKNTTPSKSIEHIRGSLKYDSVHRTSNFKRKYSKFKRNPKLFFQDSKYIYIRWLSRLYARNL